MPVTIESFHLGGGGGGVFAFFSTEAEDEVWMEYVEGKDHDGTHPANTVSLLLGPYKAHEGSKGDLCVTQAPRIVKYTRRI
jgi:hypothetical protein